MSRSRFFVLLVCVVFCGISPAILFAEDVPTDSERRVVPEGTPPAPPEITFWYGETQRFGHLGDSQPLANVLGSITPKSLVADAWYSLNRGGRVQLRLGSDLHRLAYAGDFNIELDRTKFRDGENKLVVGLHDIWGRFVSRELTINYTRGMRWELPYEVDFAKGSHLQDVVDVVDGRWTLTADGVRTAEPYYDRQLAFGDDSWSDYEVEAEIIFHRHLPAVLNRLTNGPPYLSHAHTSFNLRWRGHPDDGFSPRRDWMNLGSLVALRSDLNRPNGGAYWWVHFGRGKPGSGTKRSLLDFDQKFKITEGIRYRYRMRVETLPNDQARYSTKVWRAEEDEPDGWQLQAVDASEALPTGSVVFVVHHSDVTLCSVKVRPLTTKAGPPEE